MAKGGTYDWKRLAQPKDGTFRLAAKGGPLRDSYLRIHPDVEKVPFPGGEYRLSGEVYVWHPTIDNEGE